MAASRSPLIVTKILRESIKKPAKNGKLMFQVMLLILCPLSLLFLLHSTTAGPLMAKVEDSFEDNSLEQKDVRALVGLEFLFVAVFWILSYLGMVVTIYASASTYTEQQIKLMDLILSIKSTWKKPLITWLYVSTFTIIYIVLVLITLYSISLTLSIDSSYVLSGLIAILAIFVYLYVAAIWALGLVVSVVEKELRGAKAIQKAEKLLGGRKLEGLFIMLILILLSVPIYILLYVILTDDDDELGLITQFLFGFVATLLLCLAKFFTFVVFTVLYYECKLSQGEEVEMEMLLGPHENSSVSQKSQFDPAFP